MQLRNAWHVPGHVVMGPNILVIDAEKVWWFEKKKCGDWWLGSGITPSFSRVPPIDGHRLAVWSQIAFLHEKTICSSRWQLCRFYTISHPQSRSSFPSCSHLGHQGCTIDQQITPPKHCIGSSKNWFYPAFSQAAENCEAQKCINIEGIVNMYVCAHLDQ